MGSKLMRLAQGEVMGAGEVGDQTMIGAVPEEEVTIPVEPQHGLSEPARPTQAASRPAEQAPPKVFKPIDLDLSGSESEDGDDEMEQIA